MKPVVIRLGYSWLTALICAKSANVKHVDKCAGSKPSFLDFVDVSHWVSLELLLCSQQKQKKNHAFDITAPCNCIQKVCCISTRATHFEKD